MLSGPATSLVKWHLRVYRPCPAIDAAPHRLHGLEALLAKPVGHAQRTHPVMTHDDNVVVGIKLLHPRWNLAHRNMLRSLELGLGQLPRLANVKQRKGLAAFLKGIDLTDADFEIQRRS